MMYMFIATLPITEKDKILKCRTFWEWYNKIGKTPMQCQKADCIYWKLQYK